MQAGANGTNGENGKEGTAGKNGKEGKEGKEGALGTAGTTLPAGATETGTWDFGPLAKELTFTTAAISIPIPLAKPIEAGNTHFVTEAEVTGGTVPAGCKGGSAANPTAEPGNL